MLIFKNFFQIRWLTIFQSLSLRNRVIVLTAALIGTITFLVWALLLHRSFTVMVPKEGGKYTEGMVSAPRYINPILAQTSQADADLVRIVYDGLFARGKDGSLEPLLGERYEVSDGGKKYTVYLREGVTWHDGEEFTAEDVVYTIKTLQDPTFKSPLRAMWLGVEVEAKDKMVVEFTLKKEYFGFIDNLTVGILPKHIWQGVSSDTFLLSEYNLTPIGTGPYRFVESEKNANGNILSIELEANPDYFLGRPYINSFSFYFYENQEALLAAYNKKQVDGIYNIRPEDRQGIAARNGTTITSLEFPRIFGVFWNITKSVPLADPKVREALSYAIDRDAIVGTIMHGDAQAAYGPLLPFMFGYSKLDTEPKFDRARAESILDAANWKKGSDGMRAKDGKKLEFTLTVPDWPELVATGEELKEQLASIGVAINLSVLPAADVQQNSLKNRDYEAILFGQASYLQSDPFSFWHSSQKGEGGLNFSLFENKEADETLEKLRTTTNDENAQKDLYKKFLEIFYTENPSLMLYSPNYLYVQTSDIKGLETTRINTPSGRLSNVKNWYINTSRSWKK